MNAESSLIKSDIEAYLKQHEQKDLLRFLTCGSVDDGKSTLIGRLLHDSKMIYEDQLAAISKDSKTKGSNEGELDLALLVDGLQSEREQGITIDVAYRYFSTDKRKFIIADTPGHEQYTRNMATGASNCDLAIILVDARYGLQTQTKRHSFIVSLLGIKQVVVAVNKMDLIDFSESTYLQIQKDYLAFAEQLNIDDIKFAPISALNGDNVVEASENTPWYQGESLINMLENAPLPGQQAIDSEFRFPVQYVNRPNLDFRGYCGTVASGNIKVGDEIRVLPSDKRALVQSIVDFDGEHPQANAGQAVTLTLDREIDISRGDMIIKAEQQVAQSNQLKSWLIWMSEQPLTLNRQYAIKFASKSVQGEVSAIEHLVDVNTLEKHDGEQMALNEIAVTHLKLNQAIVVDSYQSNPNTGAFVLIDKLTNGTVAAGMVIEMLENQQQTSYSEFEVELNALIRKHFPHWNALDISKG